MQQVLSVPYVRVRNKDNAPLLPDNKAKFFDWLSLLYPAPETTQADAGETLLAGFCGFLLSLRQIKGNGRIKQRRASKRRDVEMYACVLPLRIAHSKTIL